MTLDLFDKCHEYELANSIRERGVYTYFKGWNWRAVVATLLGVGLAIIGRWVPAFATLYQYAWFVGFGVGFLLYVALMKVMPVRTSELAAATATESRQTSS